MKEHLLLKEVYKIKKTEKIWNTALYIRLSREDEGEKEESLSVTSQREILKAYIDMKEELILYDIYVDDGFSGTNFDRPDFKRMMRDIEKGFVNCVIVKDLSRFCRNAVDGGYYLDNVFTRLQVRFIAINNCLDTFSPDMNASTRCITVGVQNVINESVAATTSVNVRSTLNMTRSKGEFIGSFASYGYIKDPKDRHKLIKDQEAADVVTLIYSMFLQGKSVLGIAKELNGLSIPAPGKYKQLKGSKYSPPSGCINDGLWSDRTVRRILTNEIYTGTMVQGKQTTVSYKIKKCRAVPMEDWIKVPDTHEAIISKEDYLKAQKLFSNHVHADKNFETDIFAGLLKCSQCNRCMNKKTYHNPNKTYVYYKCATRSRMKASACQSHTIRKDKLYDAVLLTLQKLAEIFLEEDSIRKKLASADNGNSPRENLSERLRSLKEKREREMNLSLELYPDFKSGIISKEEYLALKEKISKNTKRLEEEIKETEKAIEENENSREKFSDAIKKYTSVTELSRPLLLELIDEIIIFPQGQIEIKFKFRDAYRDALVHIN